MTRFAHIALAAAAAVAAMPAQAADFVINTANGTVNNTAIATGGSGYDLVNYSVKSTDNTSTVNVKASAWSRDINGNYSAGKVVSWGSNGLGIYQTGETTGNNLHQIDNVNGWEFLVLQFDQAVSLQSAVLKSYQISGLNYVDSDAFIGWSSAAFNTQLTASALAANEKTLTSTGNWFNSDSTDYGATVSGAAYNGSLTQTQTQTYNLSPSQAGTVWIIGGSVNGPDWKNDAFKLNTIKVSSGVPEPTTWMMMILGFGMVGAAVRRRRSSDKAVLA